MTENETPQQLTLLPSTTSPRPTSRCSSASTRRPAAGAFSTSPSSASCSPTVRPRRLSTPPLGAQRPDRCPNAESSGSSGMMASELVVTPLSKYSLDVGPARRRTAVHDQVVHHLVGNCRQRRLAVAGLPGVPHRPEHLAPSEPLVERGVHGHVHVGRDRVPGGVAHHIGAVARAHEDARHELTFGAARRIVRRRRPRAARRRPRAS